MTHQTSPEWEKRFGNEFGNFGLYGKGDFGSTADEYERVKAFIRQAIAESVAAERERIMKALPKERECLLALSQVRDIINPK